MTDSQRLILQAVCLPPALRGPGIEGPSDQAFDVWLHQGLVSEVFPVPGPPQGLLLPRLVDLHVHLDKSYTVAEAGPADGDLFAAIERMARHRQSWATADLRARMQRALSDAYQSGTRALRTHLDWVDGQQPLSLAVFAELLAEWRGRLALQCVSLTPLDAFDDAAAAQGIAQTLADFNAAHGRSLNAAHGGSQSIGPALMGCFVYRNPDLQARLRRVFALAAQHGLALDVHVDEGLDADACGLPHVAQLTIAHGMQGRVTCGHACSLSVQPDAQAAQTLALCAQAGIHLVALPSTNLYLQGSWQTTPVERGITRLLEARSAGVSTSIATDNVADSFYPYGSYDLLETFGLGVQMAHLAPALDWLGAITTAPARAMGLPWDGLMARGCPADLLHLPLADAFTLLSPQGRQRRVYVGGTLQPEGAWA